MQQERRWARLGLAAVLTISAGIAFLGQAEMRASTGLDTHSEFEHRIDVSPGEGPVSAFDGKSFWIGGTGESDWQNCTSDA